MMMLWWQMDAHVTIYTYISTWLAITLFNIGNNSTYVQKYRADLV